MLPPALSPRLPNSGPSPRSQGRIFALHVSLMPFAFSASGAAAPPRNWVALALLIALSCLWIATLGGNVLLSPDEGRYATISLDMLRSGDWITPRLNGVLYFEKPPLQYWAGALSLAVFGVNEFAARLWSGLAGLASVFLVGYTARALWGPRAGQYGLIVAGATTWIVANSHFLALDAGLNGALTLTLCAVLLAERPGLDPRSQRRWMLAAWLGMALAVLSKGLIGLLIPGTVLVLISLWRLDFSLWARLQWLRGLALFLVVAAPWFVIVSMRNPDFAWFFFIHEHFQRYLTTEHHRTGAWWYFVPYLLVGLMPWTSALPWLLRARRADFAGSLLVIWTVFVFAFFSASGSKLPSYILPIFPALALLIARALARVADDAAAVAKLRWHLVLPAVAWGAVLIVSTQAGRFTSEELPVQAIQTLARTLGIGAAAFLLAAGGAWWLLKHGRLGTALALVGIVQLGATLAIILAHDDFRALKSSAAIAQRVKPLLAPDTVVYSVGTYDQTLPFYLDRHVVLVDYRDEFEFGQDREPARWIPSVDAFLALWRQQPHAAVYLTTTSYAQLRERGLDGEVVYADVRRVMVLKTQPVNEKKTTP